MVWLGFSVNPAHALPTLEEALKLAFETCPVERRVLYLTKAQLAEVRKLSGEEKGSAMVVRYEARCPGKKGAAAYVDTHRVRTKPETLLVVVGADQRVQRTEVISFQEPPDYIPRSKWYEQLNGKPLSDELKIKREISPVTGATLTANATVSAVRRVLAIHEVESGPSAGRSAP